MKFRVTHNDSALANDLNTGRNARAMAALLRATLAPQVNAAENALVRGFDQLEETRELKAGETAANISGSLNKGNLFAFFGFNSGEDPTAIVRDYLKNDIPFFVRKRNNFGSYRITFEIPSYDDVVNLTTGELEWTDKSWVDMIENGFTNFGPKSRFYFGDKPGKNSRSGVAAQRKGNATTSLSGNAYITKILERLQSNLTRNL